MCQDRDLDVPKDSIEKYLYEKTIAYYKSVDFFNEFKVDSLKYIFNNEYIHRIFQIEDGICYFGDYGLEIIEKRYNTDLNLNGSSGILLINPIINQDSTQSRIITHMQLFTSVYYYKFQCWYLGVSFDSKTHEILDVTVVGGETGGS